MLAHLREALKDTLPPRLVHAYRLVRHTMWWPTELEMVAARPPFTGSDPMALALATVTEPVPSVRALVWDGEGWQLPPGRAPAGCALTGAMPTQPQYTSGLAV